MASSAASTVSATHTDGERDTDSGDAQLQLRRKISQAVDEGHDADIPSSAGYVLNEEEELKRQRSIAERRRNSFASKRSKTDRDVEKAQPGEAAGSSNESNELDDSDSGPNVVWWKGPDDPENPYNWPTWRKVLNCGLISAMTFISPLASCKPYPTFNVCAHIEQTLTIIQPYLLLVFLKS